MKRILTIMSKLITMTLVGKTQAGSAGVQPARDSQLNATNCRWNGSLVPSHFTNFADNSELCYALKNLIKRVPPKAASLFAEDKKSLLTKKWICPIHAEPVQQYTPPNQNRIIIRDTLKGGGKILTLQQNNS